MKNTHKLITLLVLITLSACGKNPMVTESHGVFGQGQESVDAELRPYFDSYIEKAGCLGVPLNYKSISVKFTDELDGYRGLCRASSDGVNSIIISKEEWLKLTPPARMKLVYHEMAHCTLGMNHIEDPSNKTHIMTKSFNRADQYEFVVNFEVRVKELFNRTNNTSCSFKFESPEDTENSEDPSARCSSSHAWNDKCARGVKFKGYALSGGLSASDNSEEAYSDSEQPVTYEEHDHPDHNDYQGEDVP